MKYLKVFIPLALVFSLSLGLLIKDSFKTEARRKVAGVKKEKNSSQKKTLSKKTAANSKSNKKEESTSNQSLARPNSIKAIVNNLKILRRCHLKENCSYSKELPESYMVALADDTAFQLSQLETLVKKQNLKRKFLENIAFEFMKWDMGHVKLEALRLASTQEKSTKMRNFILTNIIDHYDAEIITPAALELGRYDSKEDRAIIVNHFVETMKTGSPFVSEELAKLSGLFINSESKGVFESALKELKANTNTFKNLESALSEYAKRLNAA